MKFFALTPRRTALARWRRFDGDGDSVADEIASVTDSFGRSKTYAYSSGKLATITDHAGRVTSYTYSSGRVATITEPDPDGGGPGAAPVTTYEYYTPSGLLKKVTAPGNRITEYEYDHSNRLKKTTIDGESWHLTSAQAFGVVNRSVTGFNTSNLASSSHLSPNPVAIATDELGNETRYKFDAYGYVTEVTNDLGKTWIYERDDNGLLTRMVEPDPDGAGPLTDLETLYTYDAKFNLTDIQYADSSTESWTYDATFSQVTSYTDAENRLMLFDIDPTTGDILSVTQVVGSIGGGDDVTTEFTYTDGTGDLPGGLLLTVEDPLGRITTYTYQDDDQEHDFGWVTSVTYADGTADEASVFFEYLCKRQPRGIGICRGVAGDFPYALAV